MGHLPESSKSSSSSDGEAALALVGVLPVILGVRERRFSRVLAAGSPTDLFKGRIFATSGEGVLLAGSRGSSTANAAWFLL